MEPSDTCIYATTVHRNVDDSHKLDNSIFFLHPLATVIKYGTDFHHGLLIRRNVIYMGLFPILPFEPGLVRPTFSVAVSCNPCLRASFISHIFFTNWQNWGFYKVLTNVCVKPCVWSL